MASGGGPSGKVPLGGLRPFLAADVRARRQVLDGEPVYVLQHPMTMRFFRLDPALHAFLARLDGSRTLDEALAAHGADQGAAPLEPDGVRRAVAAMLQLGLLRLAGGVAPAAPPAPPAQGLWKGLSAVLYVRFPLGDLGPAVRRLAPILGPLFTRPGLLLWALTVAAGIAAVLADGQRFAREAALLLTPDLAIVLAGAAVFVATKMLHETAHAMAAHRLSRAEGVRLTVFPFGIGFMVGMPVPWVDATGAWALTSRARRAAIGLAGVYMDTWLAALAALAWAFAREGGLGPWPMKVMLVCGASTLLFNLNPLVRLDGYHVLVDLLGTANLLPRARAANAAWLRRLFGGTEPLPDGAAWLIGYNLAAMLWRLAILLGAFWFVASAHWAFGVALAAAVLGLFVARPLVNGALWLAAGGVKRPARFALTAAAVAGLAAAALLVPLPQRITAEGVALADGTGFAFAPSDGVLRMVARPGPVAAGEPVLRVDNPEAARLAEQLSLEREALRIRAREAGGAAPAQIAAVSARLAAVEEQIGRLAEEIARATLVAPVAAVWQPGPAEALRGAWVRGDDPRPLGTLVPVGAALRIEVALDQQDGPPVASALATGDRVEARPRGDPASPFAATVLASRPEARPTLPSPVLGLAGGGRIAIDPADPHGLRAAERIFVLELAPAPEAPPLRHGQAVEVRVGLPPAPLAGQLWQRLRRLAQQRLAV